MPFLPPPLKCIQPSPPAEKIVVGVVDDGPCINRKTKKKMDPSREREWPVGLCVCKKKKRKEGTHTHTHTRFQNRLIHTRLCDIEALCQGASGLSYLSYKNKIKRWLHK